MAERKLALLAALLLAVSLAAGGCAQADIADKGNDAAPQAGGSAGEQPAGSGQVPMTDEEMRMAANREKVATAVEVLGYPDKYIDAVMDALEELEVGTILEAKVEEMPDEKTSQGETYYILIVTDDQGFIYDADHLLTTERHDYFISAPLVKHSPDYAYAVIGGINYPFAAP
jgi:hypothetical protein